jgi:hypothetical protein
VVILPANLEISLGSEEFPRLNNTESPLREQSDPVRDSWVKIASKSNDVEDNNSVK